MSFLDNLANTLTDFIQDTADAVTDFIEDTADAATDFLGGLTYGNYGGLNYSSGTVGGTITETSPPPIDAYDAAYYLHDVAHQSTSDPALRLPADIQVTESVADLTLHGGGSVNVLTGTDGADVQVGSDGDDWIYGGLGNDQPYGGGGTDGVFGGEGNDILVLEAGHDAGWGGAGNDYIYAGTGNDFLFGGAGYDVLLGEAGYDFLFGGGSDIALGEADYLFGGAGKDVFGIQDIAGANVIQDFNRAEGDVILLKETGLLSFADVLAHTTDFGSFSVITISPTENIWVIGQTPTTFQATDFSFS